jgi:DNA-binding NtrC family response regulator
MLVVEDERAIQIALRGSPGPHGYDVAIAASGSDAIALLEQGDYDLVLTDLALGQRPVGHGRSRAGEGAAPGVRRRDDHGARLGEDRGRGDEGGRRGLRAQAVRQRPDPARRVARARRTRLARENRLLLERVEREYGFENLIGAGAAMQRVFAAIQKVAETDLTVLVRGESGTGKELVAQALHQRSPRRDGRSSRELRGDQRRAGRERAVRAREGAFTGADARRRAASRPPRRHDLPRRDRRHGARDAGEGAARAAGALVRARRGTAPIEVDVRVVAATHRNLEQEVARGQFREDLYYRLRVVELALPPLRERSEDVPRSRCASRAGRERLGRRRAAARRERARRARAPRWPGKRARAAQPRSSRPPVLAAGR